jgi:hypothetical protein
MIATWVLGGVAVVLAGFVVAVVPAGAGRAVADGLVLGLAIALVIVIMLGLALGMGGVGSGLPLRVAPLQWRQALTSWALLAALITGGVIGVPFGLVTGSTPGVAFGATFGLASGLAVALSRATSAQGTGSASAFTPRTSWRNDRNSWLVTGITIGLALGLADWVADWLTGSTAGGLAVRLASRIVLGLALGLGLGLVISETWVTRLAFVQLAIRWHTPVPLALMRFLEDACERNVLRTIGPVYQFRHTRLQDRLDEQGPAPGGDRNKAQTPTVTSARST